MNKVTINEAWQFKQAGKVEQVNLPHTWNAFDGQDGGNNYYRGKCVYEKVLEVGADQGKLVHLEFEAANSLAEVYVNDILVGNHQGGYSTFRFNITEQIKFGVSNIIRVEVDNRHNDSVYPLIADFTFMGGLYRDAYLITSHALHIDLDDDGAGGVYVAQAAVSEQQATLLIDTRLRNAAAGTRQVKLVLSLCQADGAVVVSDTSLVDVEGLVINQQKLVIDNPRLWQGLEDPYQYRLKLAVYDADVLVDSREIDTGLRYYEVCPEQGFKLNGKLMRLNGVSRHQDREDIGWALSKAHQDADMAIIQEIGANSIRLAHYQHNQYFYDLCDRIGMVVWAEIPYITRTSPEDVEGINALDQMRELVKQNYNHASILFWGVQNEITIAGKVNNVENIVTALHEQTKALDPFRLTTQAQVSMLPNSDSLNKVTDINAYNKYFGWYNGKVEEFDSWMTEFHQACPDVPLAISEYGAEGIQMYHTDTPRRSDYTEEYHALYHEKVLEIFSRHEYLWATYVWNMFDFACDLRDEGGVKGMNNKGLVRHDHKTRKDAFYIYQARWSKQPMLHITAKNFVKRATDKITIKIYSNQNEVNLRVGGEEFASLVGGPVFEFHDVSLASGTSQIEAYCPGTQLVDKASFERVELPEPSYTAPKAKNLLKEAVANWFDADQEQAMAEQMAFPEGYFSVKSRIGNVCDNPEGLVFMQQHLAPLFDHPMFDFIKNLSFEGLAAMNKGTFTPQVLRALNQQLIKIKDLA